MTHRIYLDNNATTFVDPRVSMAIYEHLKAQVGNPSSVHAFGREARAILQNCRRSIAQYLKVKPTEIIFTSGGTEGVNMALQGLIGAHPKGHVISSSVEHSCVHANLLQMQGDGWDVSFLPPGLLGAVTPEAVRAALRGDTRLITLMAANNETGVRTDIQAIASVAEEAKIPFIVDGVALLGKEVFSIPQGVSAMCFSGHKIHAPPGIGFCFIRHNFKLSPLIVGGEQEFQRRGGTENLPGVVGLSEAIRILQEVLPEASERMRLLTDKLQAGILSGVPGSTVNGGGLRVSNTVNIAFGGADGEALLTGLDMKGVAASHGSACSSGALEPSRVLLNMGVSREIARSSLRFSLSRLTTEEDVETAIRIIVGVSSRLYRR